MLGTTCMCGYYSKNAHDSEYKPLLAVAQPTTPGYCVSSYWCIGHCNINLASCVHHPLCVSCVQGVGGMRVFTVGVLLACLHAVHSQSLRHSGDNFPNNSFIDRGIVSVSGNLECLTSHSPCCDGNTAVGGWRDPTGGAIQEGAGGTSPFYVTRATGAINLNRLPSSNGQEQLSGMYQCQIPGSSGDIEELFIYLGNQSTGKGRGEGSVSQIVV